MSLRTRLITDEEPDEGTGGELPSDLVRLRDRYPQSGRLPGERSVGEIAERFGVSRPMVLRMLMQEIEAGRWERREAIVSGRRGFLYREKGLHKGKSARVN